VASLEDLKQQQWLRSAITDASVVFAPFSCVSEPITRRRDIMKCSSRQASWLTPVIRAAVSTLDELIRPSCDLS
jgi:hypothetical protein